MMILKSIKGLVFILLLAVISMHANGQQSNSIKNGTWLGIIIRPDSNKIQFNFISAKESGKQVLYILNGDEKLLVDDISIVNDSVLLTLPFFNASLLVSNKWSDHLIGYYIKKVADKNVRIPFEAIFGIQERFPNAKKVKFKTFILDLKSTSFRYLFKPSIPFLQSQKYSAPSLYRCPK